MSGVTNDRLLLDAPSLVYRAFFALPQTITAPSGQPVNAVRGFMEMCTRLLLDRGPSAMVAVFDNDWRPSFRVAAYPGYKAERPDEPEELGPQFDILARVLDAAGLVRAEADGLEADDVIATLVARKQPDERAVVVTGDRDLICLVRDPDVSLLFTLRGVRQLKEFDEAAVLEDYGIRPQQYVEFAMLRGDPSDGLPGIVGIGPKRAAQLLNQYGSVQGLLDHADRQTPKLSENLRDASEYLDAMRTVVTLIDDAEVEMTEQHQPDDDELRELAERFNLGSSAARLAHALRPEARG
jgi:5'-3' exonuclease